MDLSKLHLHWRVGKRGKKEYKSYSLARAYREDGKNKKKIEVKLGTLSEEEADQWRRALRSLKDPQVAGFHSVETVLSHRNYLDLAVLLEVWNFWELSSVFDAQETKQRKIPLSTVAALLSINRSVDPSTKSRVAVWGKKTTLPFLLNFQESEINSSRIFRELIPIEECKDNLTKHLCKKMSEHYPEAMKSLFYDLSSTTFTGSRCLLVNWGHCKEGYENHVVLALIVNTKGLPVYWEVLEGCTPDAKTVSWLLDRLKTKLSIEIPTMVFDRGMVSDDNLALIEEDEIKYITAMDKPQIKKIAKIDFSSFAQMTPENVESKIGENHEFTQLDNTTYCKELGIIKNRRYVLCFNSQLFKDQRKAREDLLDKLESLVKTENQELLQAKKDREASSTKKKFISHIRKLKLQSFVSIRLDDVLILRSIQSYEGRIHINKKKKLEAGKMDGFWLLVTNHIETDGDCFTLDTKSVVQPYRDKVVIESSFRDIKSFVEVGPVHVWKSEHVKAHYTICVLSHLLNRTLSLWLQETKGQKTEKIVSPERLYETLEGCLLNLIKTESTEEFYSMTVPTAEQKELLERLDMKHLICSAQMKSINIAASKITSK